MIRLSKLADYGIVLLSYIGMQPGDSVCTARQMSDSSGLPLPTVSKVLKSLSRAGLLVAQRGKHGGYTLAQAPTQINIAEIIIAIDGPIELTQCSRHTPSLCSMETTCPVRNNWQRISQTVSTALGALTLADMTPQDTTPLQHISKH